MLKTTSTAEERRDQLAPRGLHASDVPSTTRNERDTRQECGHGLAAHHHLRRLGAGSPLLAQMGVRGAHGESARPRVHA